MVGHTTYLHWSGNNYSCTTAHGIILVIVTKLVLQCNLIFLNVQTLRGNSLPLLNLKEACKKYTDITAENLSQVDQIL